MTHIGHSLVITGELVSTEDITIDGRVNGHLTVRDANLTISNSGTVKADVRAVRVLVLGQVKGSITASERIELTATSRMEGSLSANRVVLADGARFDGGIDMSQRTIAAKMAQHRAGVTAAAQETR
jgi:cytoskeletal protein CcmA (bactofilin family)